MKKVEFLGRFANRKKKTEEEKQEEQIDRLINPDKYDRPGKEAEDVEIEFMYDPITLDLEDIGQHIRLDKHHTQLNMKNSSMFVVKIPYDSFNELYQSQMGIYILKVAFAKEDKPKTSAKAHTSLFDDVEDDSQ